MVYEPQTSYTLNKIIQLIPSKVTLFGSNDSVLISGKMDINSTFTYTFYLEYHYTNKSPDFLTMSVGEIQAFQQNSLETFFLKFFGANITTGLLNELVVSRGIENLSHLRIKGILLKLYLLGPKQGLTILNLQVAYIPDFSLSPEFLLNDCQGDYLIFLQGDPLAFTWRFLIDCACKRFEDMARLFILKAQGRESLYLNATRQNLTLKQIEEKLFETGIQKIQANDSSSSNTDSLGFFSEIRKTSDLKKYVNVVDKLRLEEGNIDDFSTEIYFSPQLTYKVTGVFYIPDLSIQGRLNAIVTNIGGIMTAVVHLEFPNVTPEKLLKNFLSHNINAGLESLADTINPKGLVLITASRDVDLKNFLFVRTKNIYNETFWERGVHLGYEFQFKDCKTNRFCDYMAKNYDPNYLYSLYGELSEQESLRLIGKPQKHTSGVIVEPVSFTPEHIKLEIPLTDNINLLEEYEEASSLNFELLGDFSLNIENNGTLHFTSELDFLNSKIVVHGASPSLWSSALDLHTLNLSQISMHGRLDANSWRLLGLQIGSLAVFGRDCFLQTVNDSLFQRSRCFYGNADVTADYQDYNNNYLEGYFPNSTIWNLLFNGLDYEQFRQYESISKHISNIKLNNGVDLLYSMRELSVKSLRFKNHTQLQESRVIPKGFTIKGLANVVGLDGVLLMNIKPKEKVVSGVFYLNSAVSFAGGNGVILQTDLNSTDIENSVVFRLNGSEIPQDKQVNFLGKINLFNVQTLINMSITNDQYFVLTSGRIFQGIYDFKLELRAPYTDALQAAAFKIRGFFSKELIQDLENSLRNRTIDWMNYVKFILERLDQKIIELKNLMEVKQADLCNEELCPKELQCVEEPKQQCLEYSKKTVCKKQESFCLKPEQVCTKEQKVCVSEKKDCVNYDDKQAKCLEFKSECLDYVTICNEWKHVCNAETVLACNEFEIIEDNNDCKRSEFVCKIQEIRDLICQNDCRLRKKQYEKYEKLHENLVNGKELFNSKLTGFWIMNDEIQKHPNKFLNVLEGKFEENMPTLLDPRELTMQVSIVSFKEDLKNEDNLELIPEKDFDFRDLDNFSYRIFVKLARKWSERFNFDMILLKENEADLLNSLFTRVGSSQESFTGLLLIY